MIAVIYCVMPYFTSSNPRAYVVMIGLDAELMCAELEIENAEKIWYSNPDGPNGRREEGSVAMYSCLPGFHKPQNSVATRVCKSGKFTGAPQLCVGAFLRRSTVERSEDY